MHVPLISPPRFRILDAAAILALAFVGLLTTGLLVSIFVMLAYVFGG